MPGTSDNNDEIGAYVHDYIIGFLTVDFHETELNSKLQNEIEVLKDNGFYFQNNEKKLYTTHSKYRIPINSQLLNRFSYVLNNPLRFTDPSGHQSTRTWIDLGGGWKIGVDKFTEYGRAGFELHVYSGGKEVGIYNYQNGWINKHGLSGQPNMPISKLNNTNGVIVNEMRNAGYVAPKGRENIKNGSYRATISQRIRSGWRSVTRVSRVRFNGRGGGGGGGGIDLTK